MSVVGVPDGRGTSQSPGSSGPKVASSKEKSKIPASKPSKSSTDKPAKSVSDSRSTKSSDDARIEALDQKWSDRFNRLEALLMARTLYR